MNTEVKDITGFVGNFEVTLEGETEEIVPAGAIILALGADLYDPKGEFGYGEMPNVITSAELEGKFFEDEPPLKIDGKKPSSAAFILCVGSREPEGFTGCSRYCCPTAIKQAIQLCKQGIDTTIFYRDIRTISTGAEEMYREARGMGVLFVRIPPGTKPEIVGNGKVEAIRCFDDLLGRRLEVPTDLVVLSVGHAPADARDQASSRRCSRRARARRLLPRAPSRAGARRDPGRGRAAGRHRPGTQGHRRHGGAGFGGGGQGVGLPGLRHGHAASPAVAAVDPERCRGCGECVDICDFQAPAAGRDRTGAVARRDQRLAVQGVRHLRELVPVRRRSARGTSPTARWTP